MTDKEKEEKVCSLTISQGKNRFMVNLCDKPTWFALMWGWWPNSGDTPSYRWQKVESVPIKVKEEFERWMRR